jgi:hypothetical protein
MIQKINFGYVVWGVTSRFNNNIYSYNINNEVISLLHEMQVICGNQDNKFYSIEKSNNFSIVSMYDPNHKDNAGRSAYIVYSVVIPHGYKLNGAIINLLNKFENYFKVECKGFPIPEMFTKIFNEFSLIEVSASNKILGTKVGYKEYLSFSEIVEVFDDLEILDFRKVYFCDKAGASKLSNPNFEKVTTLERKYSVQIINFIPHEHQLYINDIHLKQPQIISGKVEINDLRKTDKIEIKRGSNQSIEVFIAKDKQLVTLPLPKIEHQGYFTIRGLDPTRYRVKVNGQEQPTSHMSGSELKIAISTEHVVVEILDKITNAIVQTHDTRINKTYVMLLQGGAYRPPGGGSGGNGGSGRDSEEPEKKSKTALILTLCSVVLLTGLGIAGWYSGLFEGEKEKPPVSGNGTKNTTPNVGSDNEGSNENEPEENKLVNPDGYTVKTGNESILTSKGLLNTANNRFYRFFNGKWEYSEKTTSDQWKDVSAADKTVILVKYFSINTTEQNQEIEEEGKQKQPEDTKVKTDEKGQDAHKKEDCKSICNVFINLKNETVIKENKKSFIEKANNAINNKNPNCDCLNEISELRKKMINLN